VTPPEIFVLSSPVRRTGTIDQSDRPESWKVWYPKGKDDPSLCLIRVDPTEAAYWDMSGSAGIRYLFGMAKAYVTGKRPPSDEDQRHTARVKL
jgi:hypothetical protein